MPQVFPGLKAFKVWTKVSWSYWALRATAWIQDKKIHPQCSFKNNLFVSRLGGKKKKPTRKNAPIVFYFECFRFYYQLKFLFHDSSAKQDGSPPPVWLAQQSLAALERDFMWKCHSVCQGDTGTGVVIFWGTRSGISEYWQYFRLRAF